MKGYSRLMGEDEEATVRTLNTYKELQPDITMAWLEEHVLYTPRAIAHYLDGMRKAGWSNGLLSRQVEFCQERIYREGNTTECFASAEGMEIDL